MDDTEEKIMQALGLRHGDARELQEALQTLAGIRPHKAQQHPVKYAEAVAAVFRFAHEKVAASMGEDLDALPNRHALYRDIPKTVQDEMLAGDSPFALCAKLQSQYHLFLKRLARQDRLKLFEIVGVDPALVQMDVYSHLYRGKEGARAAKLIKAAVSSCATRGPFAPQGDRGSRPGLH